MRAWLLIGLFSLPLIYPDHASAQKHSLIENPKVGECFKIELDTKIKGVLKVTREGKPLEIPVDAQSTHIYFEKTLKDLNGLTCKTARRYEKADSSATIGNDPIRRTLRPERSLIVAQRINDQHLCYSPGGPLTRPELEVTQDHFDTLHLTGLLPNKEVEIGDTWSIRSACVQSFCQFDGLIDQNLKGTFKEVKEGLAILRIVGDASGIEAGAQVKQAIDATVEYDLLKSRIVKLTWNQNDERDQGPVSPIASLKCNITVKREYLSVEPKELNPAAGRRAGRR